MEETQLFQAAFLRMPLDCTIPRNLLMIMQVHRRQVS